MHILISALAKLDQLYQCTPLIVGDRYTDCEIMSFLGAKLTKDYSNSFAPAKYMLSATPLAVMDALQERGFELKVCQVVDDHVTWLMSKPSGNVGGTESADCQTHYSREEPEADGVVCKIRKQESNKNVSIVRDAKSKTNEHTQNAESQTADSQIGDLEGTKSQTEEPQAGKLNVQTQTETEMSSVGKNERGTEKPVSSTSSDSDFEHGKIADSRPLDAPNAKGQKAPKKPKKLETSKNQKRDVEDDAISSHSEKVEPNPKGKTKMKKSKEKEQKKRDADVDAGSTFSEEPSVQKVEPHSKEKEGKRNKSKEKEAPENQTTVRKKKSSSPPGKSKQYT